MSGAGLWDLDYFDGYDDYADSDLPREAMCCYCHEEGLHWEGSPYGWRLFNEAGEMHSCIGAPEPPAEADDFPLLSHET